MKNPANQAWIEKEEKKNEVTIQNNARNKLLRRSMYPELSVVNAKAALQSKTTKEIAEKFWIKREFQKVLKELIGLERFSRGSTGKQTLSSYKTQTWESKSYGLFFYFHPLLGNEDSELTAKLFGFNLLTFRNWVTQPQYFCKWVGFVNGLTVADVMSRIPSEYRGNFDHIDGDLKVQLSDQYSHISKSGVLYVTSSGSNQSRQKKQKLSAKSGGKVVYVAASVKALGTGRKTKYDPEEKFIIDQIIFGWETGNPLSKAAAYELLISEFGGSGSIWAVNMKADSGFISAPLSQWLKRVLERNDFSVRKESISQTVPLDWVQIAVEATKQIRETMKAAGVTKLVNMDEVFLNYYPKETHLIAPQGVKRVGSNRGEDEKKGCTIAVGCEMFESVIMAPFLIMDGTPTGYLSRRYNEWEGPATIKFQAKHWMDNPTAMIYLNWLKSCYPNDKIGLIWDFAAAHKSDHVLNHAVALGITVGFIPAGLTSILQVCDILVNKPLKASFKKQYCCWKIRTDPGPGKKYKIQRDLVITWLENATTDINNQMKEQKSIEKAFLTFGQDHREENTDMLIKHLSALNENSIYSSLQVNQTALEIE
jgi:hypothetical protein